MLIGFLFLVAKFIIDWLHFEETSEKNKRGNPRPIPKKTKFNIVLKKFENNKDLAKNAEINAGLQGITIAPKKNPYNKAFITGLFAVGVFGFGINLEKSTLNINAILTRIKIPKAIGEIIPITLVRENLKIVVKTNPRININNITPKTIKTPNIAYVFLLVFSSPEN